jgi:serine/threonine kinase 38
MKKTEMIFKN